MKDKLSVEGQIEHMKSLGITFNVMDEESAKDFLTYNTYYFKLKSYAKNYEKYRSGKNEGKYINLDFSHLVELSTIDFHLSRFILKLVLDIEHALKVKLIRDLTENPVEDGYSIVEDFIVENEYIKKHIDDRRYSSACSNLISKHDTQFSVWILTEILSFGDFIKLFNFYYKRYPDNETNIKNYLWSAKFLRNAAAHCNCLLNSIKTPYKDERRKVKSKAACEYLSKIPNLSKESINKKMSNVIINDFIATLLLYDLVVKSPVMKQHRFEELEDLLDKRFLNKKEYFSKNDHLKSSYNFAKKFFNFKKNELTMSKI